MSNRIFQNSREEKYNYITDEALMQKLDELGFKYLETGINPSTNERYWKYLQTNELSSVVVPWETEKRKQKYSLDRWQMTKG